MACCRRFVIAFETTTRHISHWITYILPLLFGVFSDSKLNKCVCVCVCSCLCLCVFGFAKNGCVQWRWAQPFGRSFVRSSILVGRSVGRCSINSTRAPTIFFLFTLSFFVLSAIWFVHLCNFVQYSKFYCVDKKIKNKTPFCLYIFIKFENKKLINSIVK